MKKTRLLFIISIAVSLISQLALADQKLATEKNCMTCHTVEKKLLGPGFKDVSAKYANQKEAIDKLSNKILKGSTGVWGTIPMPANAQVNEAEARKLASWILSLK